MKRIKLSRPKWADDVGYPDDENRIIRILKQEGYLCDRDQAKELWEIVSDGFCASWLGLTEYSDKEVFEALEPYFEAFDDE